MDERANVTQAATCRARPSTTRTYRSALRALDAWLAGRLWTGGWRDTCGTATTKTGFRP